LGVKDTLRRVEPDQAALREAAAQALHDEAVIE